MFHENMHMLKLEIVQAIHAFAPRIFTAGSSAWGIIFRGLSLHAVIAWTINFRSSTLYQIWYNATSFFAQPHIMRILERASAVVLAIWLLITHITSIPGNRSVKTTRNENYVGHRQSDYPSSHEEDHIFWLLREIVRNCNTHWQKYHQRRCKLEKGVPPDQVEKLAQLFQTNLPSDFRIFLRLTNGLRNILDGCGDPLTFMSTDSRSWMTEMHRALDHRTQDLWMKYLVESLFGPGTCDELIEQTKPTCMYRQTLNFIHIASNAKESGGLFLVPPEDYRSVTQLWFPLAHDHNARNGSIIGRIYAHEEHHFGRSYHDLETLTNREDWLLLQVQRMGGKTHCRLYPSFTAYLQTLAELTRRRTYDLMMPSIDESYFANMCRWKWEAEWTGRRFYDDERN
ncbi:hypothetical protein GGS21DRAFT_496108 [Xylaria nigripes]|nr:hypothetical protein GGS21DRAFT_536627 [Xylaria nigripes]KAI2643388.1 hypothetical protein GGS21DRAFT_496108 [Xylaria nigripes]